MPVQTIRPARRSPAGSASCMRRSGCSLRDRGRTGTCGLCRIEGAAGGLVAVVCLHQSGDVYLLRAGVAAVSAGSAGYRQGIRQCTASVHERVVFRLCQCRRAENGDVFSYLVQCRHAAQYHGHVIQALHPSQRPSGRGPRGMHALQRLRGICRKFRQLAAAHRLHDHDGQAGIRDNVVLLPGGAECPVVVVDLQLHKVPRRHA